MKKIKFAVFLLFGLALANCGYQFVKTPTLPGGLQTLHVNVLANNTGETGIETIFTNDILYELLRAGQGLVADQGRADGELSGAITNLRIETVAKRDTMISLERRVVCYIDLRLTDRSGTTVWSARDLKDAETFYVITDNKLATEKNQKDALRRVSRRLAEKVYYRLTDNF